MGADCHHKSAVNQCRARHCTGNRIRRSLVPSSDHSPSEFAQFEEHLDSLRITLKHVGASDKVAIPLILTTVATASPATNPAEYSYICTIDVNTAKAVLLGIHEDGIVDRFAITQAQPANDGGFSLRVESGDLQRTALISGDGSYAFRKMLLRILPPNSECRAKIRTSMGLPASP